MRTQNKSKKEKLCQHTGLERLPSLDGLTLTSCCHEESGSTLPIICEIENQRKCMCFEEEVIVTDGK